MLLNILTDFMRNGEIEMKVEQVSKPKEFTPVVITLETQEELNILYAFYRVTSGTGRIRKIVEALGTSLEPFSTLDFGYTVFEGTLRTKEL